MFVCCVNGWLSRALRIHHDDVVKRGRKLEIRILVIVVVLLGTVMSQTRLICPGSSSEILNQNDPNRPGEVVK